MGRLVYKLQTPDEALTWAQSNNWLLVGATETYDTCAFLSPAGTIVEFCFERDKVTVRSLLSYVSK